MIVYGIETWGEERAERYVVTLDRAIDGLAEYPEIGRVRSNRSPEVRSIPVGEHIVYDRIEPDEILIGRIPHRRQDASAVPGI